MRSILVGIAVDLIKDALEYGGQQLKRWHHQRKAREAREAIEWALRQQELRRRQREEHQRAVREYNRTGRWPGADA